MNHIGDADLRAVLAVLVRRAGGMVEITHAEAGDAPHPAGIDIEPTSQGVRVRLHAEPVAPTSAIPFHRRPAA